jgi:hypothetical protein
MRWDAAKIKVKPKETWIVEQLNLNYTVALLTSERGDQLTSKCNPL